jgi:hypothetical protein
LLMDYIIAALQGLQGDKYASGIQQCAAVTKFTQLDVYWWATNISQMNTSTLKQNEKWVFNTTATSSANLPDTIYYCNGMAEKLQITFRKKVVQFYNQDDY